MTEPSSQFAEERSDGNILEIDEDNKPETTCQKATGIAFLVLYMLLLSVNTLFLSQRLKPVPPPDSVGGCDD